MLLILHELQENIFSVVQTSMNYNPLYSSGPSTSFQNEKFLIFELLYIFSTPTQGVCGGARWELAVVDAIYTK